LFSFWNVHRCYSSPVFCCSNKPWI